MIKKLENEFKIYVNYRALNVITKFKEYFHRYYKIIYLFYK